MCSGSAFDYATPFDIMVGEWDGVASMYEFKPDYKFVDSRRGRVIISWKKRGKIMSFDEEQFNPEHKLHETLERVTRIKGDLRIAGMTAKGTVHAGTSELELSGFETTPGIYLFQLRSEKLIYYNNQYFVDPNLRRIIGPIVESDEVKYVVSQIFTRISYGR